MRFGQETWVVCMTHPLNHRKLLRIIKNNPEMFEHPFADDNPLEPYSFLQIRMAIGESIVAFFQALKNLPR